MKLPIELKKQIDELKASATSKGYIIKDIIIEKEETNFWDLFYEKHSLKMKNEDKRPYDFDPDINVLF